jgi:hypothetical protein
MLQGKNRLLALLSYAIQHNAGRVDIPQTAAALSATEQDVRDQIDAYAWRGHITVTWNGDRATVRNIRSPAFFKTA